MLANCVYPSVIYCYIKATKIIYLIFYCIILFSLLGYNCVITLIDILLYIIQVFIDRWQERQTRVTERPGQDVSRTLTQVCSCLIIISPQSHARRVHPV